MAQINRQSYFPIGLYRLIAGIIIAIFFAFLFLGFLFRTSQLTLVNQFYLIYGIITGLTIGLLEAKIVISELTVKPETIAWRILPINIAFLVATLLLINYTGLSSFVTFVFVVPTYLISSGVLYYCFEKKENVKINLYILGLKYSKQPNSTNKEKFAYFISTIAEKDAPRLWQYTGYSRQFTRILDEKSNLDRETRMRLVTLLNIMNLYQKIGLTGLFLFIIGGSIFAIIPFYLWFNYNFNIFNILAPFSGLFTMIFFIFVLVLLKTYRAKVSKIISKIDTNKLYPLN